MSRTIVITGGTSGIGLALKDLFEKNGDTVYTFSIEESDSEKHYQGSVDHEIKVNQVFNDIHEKHGTIDMLINCAGFGMTAISEIASMEKIQDVMNVNFYGTLYCTRAALRYMKEGARIVNMSSAMALFPVPFKSIYGASKSAVMSLSMSMRMELAPAGIDVVAICPGDTKTNFSKNRIKEVETTERYGNRLELAMAHHEAKEDKRMTVEYVAEQIYKLINKPKTKPFYIIGGKYKFIYFLTRLTPKSLLLKITNKKLGGNVAKPAKKEKAPKQPKETAPTTTENQEENITTVAKLNENVATPASNEEQTAIVENETTTQENTTISQEEAKNNISNMLSKITILNKPSEQKQEAEKEATENNETETKESSTIAEQPQVEQSTQTENNPQQSIDEKQPTTTTTVANNEQTTTVAQPAPSVAPKTTTEQPAPVESAPAEEPTKTNIQFDEE